VLYLKRVMPQKQNTVSLAELADRKAAEAEKRAKKQ
jgi:hypothetical protein